MENTKLDKKRIALVSFDQIGKKMAGAAMRYFELAKALSDKYQVTLFAAESCDIETSDFQIIVFNPKKQASQIAQNLNGIDVVIAQNLAPELLRNLNNRGIHYIADLYDPLLIEILEYEKDNSPLKAKAVFNFQWISLALQLSFANHILYANSRQKDYYAGVMSGSKILGPELYNQGFSLDQFMTSAPFGMKNEKPLAENKNIVFEKFPKIKPSDPIVIWGGGIWNWFDPISLIKAFEILKNKGSDVKLLFYGVGHPNPKIKKMKMAADAIEMSKQNRTFDNNVFFNTEWVDYDQRTNYLLASKIGASTHFKNIETHFSFRTRILDYLWTGLPMILTKGDYFAELCEKENLGLVVNYESPKEIASAIETLATDGKMRDEIIKNIDRVKTDFYWKNIANNISQVIESNNFIQRTVAPNRYAKLRVKFYYHWLKKKF